MQRGKAKPAVADGDRGHAVPTADRTIRIPVQLGVVMGVEINKPRGHDEPAGIDHLGRVAAVEPTDLGDLAILDANVGFIPWHPRAIDDRATFNDGIELCHKPSLIKIFPRTAYNRPLTSLSREIFSVRKLFYST